MGIYAVSSVASYHPAASWQHIAAKALAVLEAALKTHVQTTSFQHYDNINYKHCRLVTVLRQ